MVIGDGIALPGPLFTLSKLLTALWHSLFCLPYAPSASHRYVIFPNFTCISRTIQNNPCKIPKINQHLILHLLHLQHLSQFPHPLLPLTRLFYLCFQCTNLLEDACAVWSCLCSWFICQLHLHSSAHLLLVVKKTWNHYKALQLNSKHNPCFTLCSGCRQTDQPDYDNHESRKHTQEMLQSDFNNCVD